MRSGNVLFEIKNNYLVSITISNFVGREAEMNGKYVAPATVEEVLAKSENPFPTSKDYGWKQGRESVFINTRSELEFVFEATMFGSAKGTYLKCK